MRFSIISLRLVGTPTAGGPVAGIPTSHFCKSEIGNPKSEIQEGLFSYSPFYTII